MADNFKIFAAAVRARFQDMAQEPLFVVASDRNAIWSTYLGAFPPGTDPIYRERTEHDCACCRHFVRDIGNVVCVQNGALSSVWDLNGLPQPYQTVANATAAHVKSLPIRDVFLSRLAKCGTAENNAIRDNVLFRFSHFSVDVPARLVTSSIAEKRGAARTTHAVLMRGLSELKPESVATVADLIASNSLYRGQEHQRAVTEFQTLQARFLAMPEADRRLLAWTMIASPAARLRNTVIGALVQDLSDGMDIESAVRAFETKVAPQNYKRTTALISKSMVDAAMKTIAELGLEQAMERRHARFSDVSVNSVLFVDNSVRPKMKDGSIKSLLMEEVKPAKFDATKAQEIGVDEFMTSVMPKTTSLQLYLDNSLAGNFMSMTAPVHANSGKLLRWSNDFAWSYDGNVADSIKDKVKRAGGQVENVAMRISLAWFNYDDLDLHVKTPEGYHIWYGCKTSPSGGYLDIDMNAGGGITREAVENVRWVKPPRDGQYDVYVNNFARRESIDVGFVVEIESPLGLETFRYEKAIGSKDNQSVAKIDVKGGRIEKITTASGVVRGSVSRDMWGLKTLDLVRVNSVILSPNYWDDNASGNKHWFFILEGAHNPLPTRGIYNEFLNPQLEKHRKVFEILGDKTKCPVVDEQMSGIGLSSTRKDKVTVIATGPSLSKTYTVVF